MKHLSVALALIAVSAFPAWAAPGGELGTLTLGRYSCGLPGDALGPALRRVPDADFEVVAASGYRVEDQRGTYLRTGDRVIMTAGPHQGQRFHVESRKLLRRIGSDGGEDGVTCSLGPPPLDDRAAICPVTKAD